MQHFSQNSILCVHPSAAAGLRQAFVNDRNGEILLYVTLPCIKETVRFQAGSRGCALYDRSAWGHGCRESCWIGSTAEHFYLHFRATCLRGTFSFWIYSRVHVDYYACRHSWTTSGHTLIAGYRGAAAYLRISCAPRLAKVKIWLLVLSSLQRLPRRIFVMYTLHS